MIDIKVRVYAGLRQYLPNLEVGQTASLSVPDGATVADVLHKLGIPESEVRICFVNGLYREPNYPLSQQDELALFPPIGGGCDGRRLKIKHALHPHILDTKHPPKASDVRGD